MRPSKKGVTFVLCKICSADVAICNFFYQIQYINHNVTIIIASEASFLVCSMHGFSIYIYIFQAVRRAVNVLNVSTCI